MSKIGTRLHDGWSKTGLVTVGNSDQLLTMQQDFTTEVGGPGAGTYTIQFGVTPPPSKILNTEAIISWSTSGTSVSRRISIGNGSTITGVCQAASLRVMDVSPTPNGESYRVDIMITPGSRASRMIPPVLEGIGFNLNDAVPNAEVVVPQDAGAIMATVSAFRRVDSPLQVGDVMVFFRDAIGAVITAFQVEPDGDQWVTLPPNTFDVLVVRKAGAGVTIVGNLIWGIEG